MPFPFPRSRFALGSVAACVLALLLLGGAVLLQTGRAPVATSFIGGPFALTDQDGKTVTQADFAGHPFLVFFGYTHCPDVCPTTLSDMSEMLKAYGDSAIVALFVTVDPARDTPAVLKDYLASFDPRIRGLTGGPDAVAAAEKAYRVYAKKVPTKDGDYSMDHTSIVYVMDKQGRFVSALNLQQPPKAAASELKAEL